jgi:hypothetical protein
MAPNASAGTIGHLSPALAAPEGHPDVSGTRPSPAAVIRSLIRQQAPLLALPSPCPLTARWPRRWSQRERAAEVFRGSYQCSVRSRRFQLVEARATRPCRFSVGIVVGAIGHQQIVERALGRTIKALEHGGTPALLEAVKGRTDEPIDAAARWWLDTQRTATFENGLADMLFTMVVRQHLLSQPGDELVSVLDGCLAKAQKLANLSAVVFEVRPDHS